MSDLFDLDIQIDKDDNAELDFTSGISISQTGPCDVTAYGCPPSMTACFTNINCGSGGATCFPMYPLGKG